MEGTRRPWSLPTGTDARHRVSDDAVDDVVDDAVADVVDDVVADAVADVVSEVIEFLLQSRGAGDQEAVDTANRDGRTCLHIAALTNNLWLAKFLLDRNADVNAVMRNKVLYNDVSRSAGSSWCDSSWVFSE